jgi:hypothetical protein
MLAISKEKITETASLLVCDFSFYFSDAADSCAYTVG